MCWLSCYVAAWDQRSEPKKEDGGAWEIWHGNQREAPFPISLAFRPGLANAFNGHIIFLHNQLCADRVDLQGAGACTWQQNVSRDVL